jgi:hypothetical protein
METAIMIKQHVLNSRGKVHSGVPLLINHRIRLNYYNTTVTESGLCRIKPGRTTLVDDIIWMSQWDIDLSINLCTLEWEIGFGGHYHRGIPMEFGRFSSDISVSRISPRYYRPSQSLCDFWWFPFPFYFCFHDLLQRDAIIRAPSPFACSREFPPFSAYGEIVRTGIK